MSFIARLFRPKASQHEAVASSDIEDGSTTIVKEKKQKKIDTPPATAQPIPETKAFFLSQLVFEWITPLLRTGHRRPLEAEDLYVLGDRYVAASLSKEFSKQWDVEKAKEKPSLFRAINKTFGPRFWPATLLRLFGDLVTVVSPLLLKELTNFASDSYVAHSEGKPLPDVGYGYIMAVVLFVLQGLGSLSTHHYFYMTMRVGFSLRTALTTNIYRKSLVLSAKARQSITTGKIVNIMSTDTNRLDLLCGYIQMLITAPIQFIVALSLLIIVLGPSALVGFAVMILFGPIQTYTMKRLGRILKLTQEVLQGIRVVKLFAWENSFLSRLEGFRIAELYNTRKIMIIRSTISSVAQSIPTIASILAFIVYALVGNKLTPATVFAALALFNSVLSLDRIREFLLAEELDDNIIQDKNATSALQIKDASFIWETTPPIDEEVERKKKKALKKQAKKDKRKAKKNKRKSLNARTSQEIIPADTQNTAVASVPASIAPSHTESFTNDSGVNVPAVRANIRHVNVDIPHGSLVAIVGSVGSGKSSLLNALVGEMKRVEGEVIFGGSVGYCPQTAWIQNATVRDNITFGLEFDETRYNTILSDCALTRDLEILPDGDMTEIGERGINFAVDAHVARHLFDHCIAGLLSDKTRILVTHQLHYLHRTDHILFMVDGEVAEQGDYNTLMANNGAFAQLMNEYGSNDKESDTEESTDDEENKLKKALDGLVSDDTDIETQDEDEDVKAAIEEKEATLYTCQDRDGYIGIYAAWGAGQIISSVFFGICLSYLSIRASKVLHDMAIQQVFGSPMSFFDTTPLGRITNRFSKDIDSTDNQLIEAIRMMLSTLAMSISTFVMICVVFPIFLAPLIPLLALYYYAQLFYRATSRELKRIDSITRSPLFAHFSETLNGLATIRAIVFIVQRWLGVRLENIANVLTLFVSIFIILSRTTSNPGLVGLVLSYSLQVTGTLNWCVRQAAEVEVNMNAVERLKFYADELEQEAPAVIEKTKPEKSWPSEGNIDITNLHLAYRKGLPNVLHGVSAKIRGGEKLVNEGSISIDGVDISSIGLTDLRSRMAIIPQDPTLFHGTVRSNLDPFNYHNDHELWDALERSGMKDYIAGQTGGLDSEITEGGENLSAGQRQLVCLARAMLVKARILIMDEATASVDMRTDALLQKAIREDFAGCTILTIAHRLNTVIDYDRIMVLDAGEVREFDSPRRLLENTESAFYSMVAETGVHLTLYL
ncbi:P-loop containing nucleoside triphosphate hydrolase protein [Syncephalis fuscata]|nr:P-loop containing nucleoside triphosphate hydrolase protein [Syncephalis fuscata]